LDDNESGLGKMLRLKINLVLAGIGGVGGAVAGGVLTYLGNVISGYPITPDMGTYAWNVGIMAGLGATLGPPMVWGLLRSVPLWRTLAEPALAGILGSVLSMVFAAGLFPIVVPGAILGAAWRLRAAYKDRSWQGGDEPPEKLPSVGFPP